jgi:hypothetical protein
MSVEQAAFTVRAAIRPEARTRLERLLEQVGQDPAGNALFPFAALRTIHFARFFILDDALDLENKPLPATLLFTSNVDGTEKDHVDALALGFAPGLDALFGCCQDYPAETERTAVSRAVFLTTRRIGAQAFYVNTRGRTVDQIHKEENLRLAIDRFLNGNDFRGNSPSAVRAAIQNHVRLDPDLGWASDGSMPPRARNVWRNRSMLAMAALGALALLPVLIPFLVLGLLLLRFKEMRENGGPSGLPANLARDPDIEAREDRWAQNPFSAVGYIKPDSFRVAVLRIVLAAIDFGAKYLYNEGSLTGVETIHFARWLIVDGNRRVVFCSNYDGSLESYMDDFINKVAWGLNAAFSNGVAYPKTNWLVRDGAKDEQAFKAFINKYQVPTQAWYSAYPYSTATNIRNNEKIRAGLFARLDEKETEKWLALL